MSQQYPSPYQPPNAYQYGYSYAYGDQLLGPARRASILQIVLASIGLLCGGCALAGSLVPRSPEQMQQIQSMFPGMPQQSQAEGVVGGALIFAFSITLLVLGLAMRRGTKGPIVASMVLTILGVGWILLNLFAVLGLGMMSGAAGGAIIGVVACAAVIVAGPLAWLIVWQVQALRATSALRNMQRQYEAQYWQYMQQRQAYGQGAPPYGQGIPPGQQPPPQQEPPQQQPPQPPLPPPMSPQP